MSDVHVTTHAEADLAMIRNADIPIPAWLWYCERKITNAFYFARAAHDAIDQRRKYTKSPYFTHPIAVAKLVMSVPHTSAMICAALLHDVVEDTKVTAGDVFAEFGAEIADMVGWLTDISKPADGSRAIRKAIDLEHSAAAPPACQTVKLADLIDNSRSIVTHDPGFAKIYMVEKQALVERLVHGDPELRHQALAILDDYKRPSTPDLTCS